MTASRHLCWECFDRTLHRITHTVVQAVDSGALRRIEECDATCAFCAKPATVIFSKEIQK